MLSSPENEKGGQKVSLSEHIEWLAREHIRRKEIKENIQIEEIYIRETIDHINKEESRVDKHIYRKKMPDLMSGVMHLVLR